MAGLFTSEEVARLKAGTVRVATLVELNFASETMRLFAGAGTRDFGGYEWRGLGNPVTIDGLAEQRGTSAGEVTLTLSGVDPTVLPLVLSEPEEIEDRVIVVFWQFMDADEQPIASPVPIFFGIMQIPSIDRTDATDDTGATCLVTLPCRGLFVGRSKPPRGRYTDRDQKARYPGDRIFERMAENRGKQVGFPEFD